MTPEREEVSRRRARVLHARGNPCYTCGGASPLDGGKFADDADPDNCRCGGGRSSAYWVAQVIGARNRVRDSWGDVA